MINAKVKRKHRNSYKLIYTALFICTLLAYLLTNDLFYSYVCYWNDRFYANPQWNPDKRYKAGIIMGGFGYMDKFTGKIGYVMYSENRTQNGIRPDHEKQIVESYQFMERRTSGEDTDHRRYGGKHT